jgi:tRNA (guanine-N7-)-methyltransferase
MYKEVLKKGGPVHLKTDSDLLYIFTLTKIKELSLITHISTADLYKSPFADDILSIKTYYEKKYLANDKNINYLKFSFE